MAVTFACGAECHTAGPPRHWDNISGSAGPTLEATIIHTETGSNGLYSYRYDFSGGAQNGYWTHNHSGASRYGPARGYFYFTQWPNVTVVIIECRNSAGTSVSQIRIGSTGLVSTRAVSGASSATGSTRQLALNTWYNIEMLADFNGGVTTDGRVGTTALGQCTIGSTTRNCDGYRIGPSDTATTIDMCLDDVLFGDVAADYPFGLGWINSHRPSADGTHTVTASNFRHQDASVVNASDTNVYTFVDDFPDNNTDWIDQRVIATTEYVEVKFPATGITNIIKSVCAIIRYTTSSAANGNASWRMLDGATLNDIFSGTVNASGGDVLYKMYNTKPSDSLAWTNAALGAIRVRFGYSSDITPNPRWQSGMFEVDYRNLVEAHGGNTQVIMLG